MKLPSHKGPIFALAVFSWHSLVALAGFAASRWIHDKAEFEQLEVAVPFMFASIMLSTLLIGSICTACFAPTKTSSSVFSSGDLQDEPEDNTSYFNSTPSCSRFFQNTEQNAFQSPLVYGLVESAAVGVLLLIQLISVHIEEVSLSTAAIGLMGLLTAVLIHRRFEQLQANKEYRPFGGVEL